MTFLARFKLTAICMLLAVLAAGCPGAIPNVVGMQESEAQAALSAAGFAVGAVTRANSDTIAEGRVISQDPSAGASSTDGSVDLVVSLGPAPVTVVVPDVTGLARAAAEAVIVAAGLGVGDITESYNNAVAAGLVISQAPAAASSVEAGSDVDLVVSLGPQPVSVPDLAGLEAAAAETAITAAGLIVGTVTEAFSATAAAGHVAGQTPSAGAEVPPGTAVNIVLSKGTEPLTVPYLMGLTLAQAESALISARLSVGEVYQDYCETVPLGRVAAQNPDPGAEMAAGAAVDIVISKGSAYRQVPDVTGISSADAEAAIVGAGLAAGTVAVEYSLTVPAGAVIEQDPVAGSTVFVGAAVDIVVSQGPRPVNVPDLIGVMLGEAEAALMAAGLAVGTVTEQFLPDETPGTVVEQTPAGGLTVDEATAVDLVVATDFRFISTIEQLQLIGNDAAYPIDAKYALTADIDASGIGALDFRPIGLSDDGIEPFGGTFDGRGHAISGLVINGSYYCDFCGHALFVELGSAATVKNLRLIDYEAGPRGGNAAGIAFSNFGLIADCAVEGSISGSDMVIGGIVGANYASGTIRGCTFDGTVEGGGWYVGGIAGWNEGRVENCGVTVDASTLSEYDYYYSSNVGGLVGGNEWGTITGCRAAGNVINGYQYAGGIAGTNAGTIDHCYSSCAVYGGGYAAGGLVGNNHSFITDCGAYGPVYSSHAGVIVGGLVGTNNGSIERSFAAGAVLSKSNLTGGLAGFVAYNGGRECVVDSFSTAYVEGPGVCGGLIGELDTGATISNCYAAGMVQTPGVAGGLVAVSAGAASNCFWNTVSTGQATSAGGTGIDTNQLLSSATFTAAGWDYSGTDGDAAVWAQVESQTVPYLVHSAGPGATCSLQIEAVNGSVIVTPDSEVYPAWAFLELQLAPSPGHELVGWNLFNSPPEELIHADMLYLALGESKPVKVVFLTRPALITSIEQLQEIGHGDTYPLNWAYALGNDIDATGTAHWNGGAGFDPIGDTERPFTGSFDGQSFGVHGLVIYRPDEAFAGLFGAVGEEAVVSNVSILDGRVAGERAGMLAGANKGLISDCVVSGEVAGNHAGGFVAWNGSYEDPMKDFPASSVSAHITRCRSSVTVTGAPYDSYFFGGFCGANSAKITQCAATGAVMGVMFVGGFVGFGDYEGFITDCYATGPVMGFMSVGGFCGFSYYGYYGDGPIARCYAACPVDGEVGAGGFAGNYDFYYLAKAVTGDAVTLTCFWDIQVAGRYFDYGRTLGMSTAQMMTAATFINAGWDFESVWGIDDGNSYPYLRWEIE